MIFIYVRNIIKYVFEIVISVLIAIEVSIPPNDYVYHLVIALILYIAFKNRVDDRIIVLWDKVLDWDEDALS